MNILFHHSRYFRTQNVKTKVVGAPKTIDGDLKVSPYIPVSFGFDTACRTYAELVGNVAVDSLSSQKYYHFVRLMGRSASNIALEVALQTCANVCLIGEEVLAEKQSLKKITENLTNIVVNRYESSGKKYGVIWGGGTGWPIGNGDIGFKSAVLVGSPL